MLVPAGYIICGAPTTGKTELALKLATRLVQVGETCHVVHTDLLRVTLRQMGFEGLESSGDADPPTVASNARLPLEVLWAKNRRERNVLIIEGSLALGFSPSLSQVIGLRGSRGQKTVIRADQPLRPEVMQQAANATALAKAVEDLSPASTLWYNRSQTIDAIVEDIVDRRLALLNQSKP